MTPFETLLTASGLSQREAAGYLDVAYDTLRGWLSGRRNVPAGATADLRALVVQQIMAATKGAQTIEQIVARASEMPEAIEIGFPADEAEAQTLGFPAVSAWAAMAGMMLAELPGHIAARVVFVPRGSTPATAAAADAQGK